MILWLPGLMRALGVLGLLRRPQDPGEGQTARGTRRELTEVGTDYVANQLAFRRKNRIANALRQAALLEQRSGRPVRPATESATASVSLSKASTCLETH